MWVFSSSVTALKFSTGKVIYPPKHFVLHSISPPPFSVSERRPPHPQDGCKTSGKQHAVFSPLKQDMAGREPSLDWLLFFNSFKMPLMFNCPQKPLHPPTLPPFFSSSLFGRRSLLNNVTKHVCSDEHFQNKQRNNGADASEPHITVICRVAIAIMFSPAYNPYIDPKCTKLYQKVWHLQKYPA